MPNRPYQFVIRNAGQTPHRFSVVLLEDEEPEIIEEISESELQPGATVTKEIVLPRWGVFELACHLPGHYEAGMALTVVAHR